MNRPHVIVEVGQRPATAEISINHQTIQIGNAMLQLSGSVAERRRLVQVLAKELDLIVLGPDEEIQRRRQELVRTIQAEAVAP